MSNETTVSRGEHWGIKAAYKTKWLIKKLKAFDKSCVARVKSKNTPGWLGHIPLVSITLAVIALLAYFSLYILFAFGILVILFSAVENIGNSIPDIINTEDTADSLTNSDDNYGSVYMNGNQGDGWYTDDSGTIKLDD
ncbi:MULTISPECIES: hypothetical protein [Enterobacterales]|jgi:hypothetical protein|nr:MULTISPECIES: hypothetical protein [Enterobacterales]ASB02696.1 DUF3742 domain-containing protein [Proteus mirabilis]EKA95905.1 hypothetical protein HMPREF1310_02838 [Proteus mirabilis WGLW4]KNZ87547.1 hypothetical protein AFL46_03740 [Providencia stuartii]MCK1142919.1 DUF3742 domain-containing protein [Providencia stuartii]MCL3218248.1 DUF3742 domain-containing protein [Klebsiella pneumoniae]